MNKTTIMQALEHHLTDLGHITSQEDPLLYSFLNSTQIRIDLAEQNCVVIISSHPESPTSVTVSKWSKPTIKRIKRVGLIKQIDLTNPNSTQHIEQIINSKTLEND